MKLFILVIIIALSFRLVAQQDSNKYRLVPKNELSLLLSVGKTTPNEYIDTYGKSYFEPHWNLSGGFQFLYSRYLSQNAKVSTGFGFWGQEYSFVVKFDENDLPGISKYIAKGEFYSGKYALFSTSFDVSYITIPLLFEYQLLNNENHHELWLFAGVDFQWFTQIPTYYGCGISTDSNSVGIMRGKYMFNPQNKFNSTLEFGTYYSYNFSPAHKLSIGLKSRISFSNQVEGTYDFLPEYPEYYANGTFSNKMSYIGIDIGYSINDRNKTYRESNYYSKNKGSKFINSDSINNLWELDIDFTLKAISYLNDNTVEGKTNITTSTTGHYAMAMQILKYRNENTAWVSGAGINITNFITDPYNHGFSLIYLTIPAKIQKEIQMKDRLNFFYNGGIDFVIHLVDNSSGISVVRVDSSGTFHNLLVSKVTNNNRLGIGVNAALGIFWETKRLNKFYLTFAGNYSLTKAYSYNYSLLQADGTFFNNSIDVRPAMLSIRLGYGITWKRMRYYSKL